MTQIHLMKITNEENDKTITEKYASEYYIQMTG